MEQTESRKNLKNWLKRFGIAGFLFFLVKGLVWLAVFFFAGSKMFESCN
jgi:hypothetical protein